jgi:hypothetical protein
MVPLGRDHVTSHPEVAFVLVVEEDVVEEVLVVETEVAVELEVEEDVLSDTVLELVVDWVVVVELVDFFGSAEVVEVLDVEVVVLFSVVVVVVVEFEMVDEVDLRVVVLEAVCETVRVLWVVVVSTGGEDEITEVVDVDID